MSDVELGVLTVSVPRPIPWSLVVPVKKLATAKSRLAGFAGARRADLALAVASDTVLAAAQCPMVGLVIVVTDDPVAAPVLAGLGAHVIADLPDAGLNPALRYGASVAERLRPGSGVGALSADLPALRAEELARVLDSAGASKHAFLCDAAEVGTTLYTALPGAGFAPVFGGNSRTRHREAGALEIGLAEVPSVRRDVDTAEDLRVAVRLGVGARTAEVAEALLGPSRSRS